MKRLVIKEVEQDHEYCSDCVSCQKLNHNSKHKTKPCPNRDLIVPEEKEGICPHCRKQPIAGGDLFICFLHPLCTDLCESCHDKLKSIDNDEDMKNYSKDPSQWRYDEH